MRQRIRNYVIENSDTNNYTLNKIFINKETKQDGTPHPDPGGETLSLIGYYNKLECAVSRVARLEADETENLKTWLEEYKAVLSEIEEILK